MAMPPNLHVKNLLGSLRKVLLLLALHCFNYRSRMYVLCLICSTESPVTINFGLIGQAENCDLPPIALTGTISKRR